MATQLVEVTEAVIDRMIKNPATVAAWPFLAPAAAIYNKARTTSSGKSCPPCQAARQRREMGLDYNAIKVAIIGLPAERKLEFKRLLGTKQVRIRWEGVGKKKVVQVF